jgi:hypothetical protein
MEILSLEELVGVPSELAPARAREKKRFKLITSEWGTKKVYKFGLPGGSTYIDGAGERVRRNYLLRHMANKTEAHLINNLIPSPALFSARLLWGESPDLMKNVEMLNSHLKAEWGMPTSGTRRAA